MWALPLRQVTQVTHSHQEKGAPPGPQAPELCAMPSEAEDSGLSAHLTSLEGLQIASQDSDISAAYTLANESPSFTELPSVP